MTFVSIYVTISLMKKRNQTANLKGLTRKRYRSVARTLPRQYSPILRARTSDDVSDFAFTLLSPDINELNSADIAQILANETAAFEEHWNRLQIDISKPQTDLSIAFER